MRLFKNFHGYLKTGFLEDSDYCFPGKLFNSIETLKI